MPMCLQVVVPVECLPLVLALVTKAQTGLPERVQAVVQEVKEERLLHVKGREQPERRLAAGLVEVDQLTICKAQTASQMVVRVG